MAERWEPLSSLGDDIPFNVRKSVREGARSTFSSELEIQVNLASRS